MVGGILVQQAERMRQLLAVQDVQLAVDESAGQMAVPLAPPVEDQNGTISTVRGGQAGGRGVSDMMRNEANPLRIQAR